MNCSIRFSLLFAALVLGACSPESRPPDTKAPTPAAEPSVEESASEAPARDAMQPAAPIALTHDYDGRSTPGETETVRLSLTAGVAGELKIQIVSKSDILIGDHINETHAVAGGDTVTVPVRILANADGKHYVNIHATLTAAGRSMSRSFSFAVLVDSGDPNGAAEAVRSQQPETTGDGRIVLPARETIN